MGILPEGSVYSFVNSVRDKFNSLHVTYYDIRRRKETDNWGDGPKYYLGIYDDDIYYDENNILSLLEELSNWAEKDGKAVEDYFLEAQKVFLAFLASAKKLAQTDLYKAQVGLRSLQSVYIVLQRSEAFLNVADRRYILDAENFFAAGPNLPSDTPFFPSSWKSQGPVNFINAAARLGDNFMTNDVRPRLEMGVNNRGFCRVVKLLQGCDIDTSTILAGSYQSNLADKLTTGDEYVVSSCTTWGNMGSFNFSLGGNEVCFPIFISIKVAWDRHTARVLNEVNPVAPVNEAIAQNIFKCLYKSGWKEPAQLSILRRYFKAKGELPLDGD